MGLGIQILLGSSITKRPIPFRGPDIIMRKEPLILDLWPKRLTLLKELDIETIIRNPKARSSFRLHVGPMGFGGC